jgi:hypothetical protein
MTEFLVRGDAMAHCGIHHLDIVEVDEGPVDAGAVERLVLVRTPNGTRWVGELTPAGIVVDDVILDDAELVGVVSGVWRQLSPD